jgi:hypothetical protein
MFAKHKILADSYLQAFKSPFSNKKCTEKLFFILFKNEKLSERI